MLAVTGSFVCCSVVVLFACCCVVLLDNRDLQDCWCGVWCGTMQEITVKAIDAVLVWCCCRVVCGVVDSLCFGFGVVDREKGWEVRELPRGLYPDKNHSFLIPF